MATYTLTIQIDSAGLRALAAAGQLVAMVKSATNPEYAVIWQVVEPTENSVISWNGTYQVYASTTTLAPGVSLVIGASSSATGGYTYTFAGGQFAAGTAGLPTSQLGLYNQDDQVTIDGTAMITGGASETANVNGQAVTGPLDAQAVLFGEHAYSVFTEQVLVFPASGVAAGTVLERSWLVDGDAGIPKEAGITLGTPYMVNLTTTTDQTIHYVDNSNSFGPGPLP